MAAIESTNGTLESSECVVSCNESQRNTNFFFKPISSGSDTKKNLAINTLFWQTMSPAGKTDQRPQFASMFFFACWESASEVFFSLSVRLLSASSSITGVGPLGPPGAGPGTGNRPGVVNRRPPSRRSPVLGDDTLRTFLFLFGRR